MGKRRWFWLAGGVVFVLLMVVVAPTVVVCVDAVYVCENTASRYGYREWPTGHRTGYWSKTSPLEAYMQAHWPGSVQHRWTQCAGTGKDIYGRSIMFGHGAPGGALHLRGDVMQAWIARHSENEIRALYKFMSKADREASKKRVDEITEEVFYSKR